MKNLFKFFFDFLSPLSRPFWILFEHIGVDCEKIPVALRKGEHLDESFARDVNRFQKVPAINDRGFVLSESVAIFHYLGRKGILTDRWYPRDLKALTRIDEYLQWQHNNLTVGAGMLFKLLWVFPLTTGVKPTAKEIEKQKKILMKNLDDLERIWLKDNKYLTGSEISFADLVAVSMVEQVVGMKLFELDEQRNGKVINWMRDVREYFGASFVEAHQFVYKFGKKAINITE